MYYDSQFGKIILKYKGNLYSKFILPMLIQINLELKDISEKVTDLQKKFVSSMAEIQKSNNQIEKELQGLKAQIESADKASEARDVKTQNLILMGIRAKDEGQSSVESMLGKFWPREQHVSENFLERNSEDGSLLVNYLNVLLEKSQNVVLTGMGGIGKTTTMKWYSQTHSEKYSHIIWLDAEGDKLFKSVKELATTLSIQLFLNDLVTPKSLEVVASDIFKKLKDSKCLFMFDNVDSENELQQVLPSPFQHHHSLVTTRLARWKGLETVEVGLFSENEAISFLKENIPSKNQSGKESLEKLCEVLQRLPLAMNQAVACMEQLDLTIAEYLEEFSSKAKEVLGFSLAENSNGKTILTTWKVSIDNLTSKSKFGGKLAGNILKAASYVYPDGILKEWLEKASQASGRFEMAKALELLQHYSLAKVKIAFCSLQYKLKAIFFFISSGQQTGSTITAQTCSRDHENLS